MAFTPVVDINRNATISSFDSEKPPTPSAYDVFISNAVNSLQQTPLMRGYSHIAKYVNDIKGHGDFLNSEQIKDKYPNIASKYPAGGYENDVYFDSNLKSNYDNNQFLTKTMPEGFMKFSSVYGGSILGAVLDPITVGAFTILGKAAGIAEGALASSKLMESLYGRVLTDFGLGAAKGVVGVTPFTASQRDYYNQIDEEAPPIWGSLILGGLFGGALDTAFGLRQIYKSAIMKQANEVAYRQMMAGKDINVDTLVKHANYEASKTWGEHPETNDDITNKINELEKSKTLLPISDQSKIQMSIDNTKLYQEMRNYPPEAVSNEEISNASAKTASWENDIDTNLPLYENAEELRKLPPVELDQHINNIDDELKPYKDNNLLDSETKQMLDGLDVEQKDNIRINARLRLFGKCATKFGG